MIFDQLWRAERRDARARKKLLEKFQPLLDAAAKQGQKGHYAVLADYSNKSNMINEAEHLESALLVQKARRLGVALPPFPKGIEDNDESYVAPGDMLRELMADNKKVVEAMRECHKLCDDHEDVASASLLENFIDQAERRLWFLFEASRQADASGH